MMKKAKPKVKFFDVLPGYLNLKILFNLVLIVFIVSNSIQLFQKIHKIHKKRKVHPYFFLGEKFAGVKDVFKGMPYVGYYTDKDLDNNKHAAQYAQAQYILAPTILDLDYSKHDYILLDCTSPKVARDKLREFKLVPVRLNRYGIILARKIK